MSENYYNVDQIASMLNIHPKTIQRYIREGRIHATKIGKGWRVSGHDLSTFIESGHDEKSASEFRSERDTSVSSVIDIPVSRREEAMIIMNTLTASLNAKPPEYGNSSMQSLYIERENMVRVMLWGSIRFMAIMLDTIISLTDRNDEE